MVLLQFALTGSGEKTEKAQWYAELEILSKDNEPLLATLWGCNNDKLRNNREER